MMAGSRPMAKRIFSGQVSMSLLRRIATTPLLRSRNLLNQQLYHTCTLYSA